MDYEKDWVLFYLLENLDEIKLAWCDAQNK